MQYPQVVEYIIDFVSRYMIAINPTLGVTFKQYKFVPACTHNRMEVQYAFSDSSTQNATKMITETGEEEYWIGCACAFQDMISSIHKYEISTETNKMIEFTFEESRAWKRIKKCENIFRSKMLELGKTNMHISCNVSCNHTHEIMDLHLVGVFV